jgi:hypothetical protein
MPNQGDRAQNPIVRCGKLLSLAALVSLLVLPLGQAAWADEDHGKREDHGRTKGEAGADRALRLLTLVPVPVNAANTTAGAMYSFDISFVDQATQTYYLGDRSNKAVDAVDAETGQFLEQISATPAFAGAAASTSVSGPNGVVAAFPWLFATDAKSRVVSFDLRTTPPTQVSDVTTSPGDPFRADELAYDPQHGTLLVINNADTPPFATLISVDKNTGKLTVGTRLTFDTAHTGINAQNGAEQPVWDADLNRFFLSIPQIGGPAGGPAAGQPLPDGAIIKINPFSATVEASYPVHLCGPAGLTLGPNQDLFIGCNTVSDTQGNVWNPAGTVPADPRDVIIDAKTGNIDANVFGAGAGDEVTFNAGDGNYYATGSGSPQRPLPAATAQGSTPAGVVDAKDRALLQLFPTFNVPAVTTGTAQHPAGTSHSIAANSHNNLVFVPLPANNTFLSPDGKDNCLTGCIGVFGHPDESAATD